MPERLSSQMSQELPLEVSAPPPLQESSHVKEATIPVPQSCEDRDPHSKEPQKPVEESQQVPSIPVLPSMAPLGNHHAPAAFVNAQVTTTKLLHGCIIS